MPPLVWVILALLALLGEWMTMTLYLLYVGVAALVVAVLSLVGVAAGIQVGAFIALSIALVLVVRPRMLQALAGRIPSGLLTNQGKLVDRIGTVTAEVTAGGGAIRIGTGEFWTARPVEPTRRLPVGERVRIRYVDGLTAFVESMPADEEDGMTETVEEVRDV